ncbi:MAG: DASS family sodium-coupled anion symporter [Rhodothermales bacterium]|nr:DASS family sodium-coupled anion symporter [Rhodothermales bacterium]MDG2015718.1 DASS family sodium-coupled anion symporter [Rhodothermales bacterium]HAY35955.1 anion transporter [Bacteroidota bacterium]
MHKRERVGLWLGPILFVLFLIGPPAEGLSELAWYSAGIGLWMATWWMTEAVPIPVTSMLPLVLFPILGIASIRDAAMPYANPLIYLFMGGFILALGMEKCGLHRRIALNVLRRVGTRPSSIIGGFMLAGALLSMWVTNTATTMMMLPIALSIVALAKDKLTQEQMEQFGPALMLSIAYACTIGGLGTLIGTIPNALVAGFMEETYGIEIGFVQWMKVGVPLVAVGLPLTYLLLTRFVFNFGKRPIEGMKELIQKELSESGPPSRDERAVAIVFLMVVFLWLTRPLLSGLIPGLSDTGIAVLGAMLLFVVPSQRQDGPWSEHFLMDWNTAKKLPWGILVLFGGGLSLASAINSTGLAVWMGTWISGISVWPVIFIIVAITVLVIFLTELTSNTATTAAFLPVMASVAIGIGQNPLLLTIPATLAASAAFMLPVATPPNAIVYGSGLVSIPQMARTGIWLNLAFTVLLSVMVYFLVQWVFGVELGVLPSWAAQ